MMDMLVIAICVAFFGFVAYQFGVMRTKSKEAKKSHTGKGRTIVVDRSKPDTSKEDAIKDKFGDLDLDDPKRPK